MPDQPAIQLSVVVPFYNEAENLPALIAELDAALLAIDRPAEILLVNDGSTDTFDRPAMSPAFPIRWLDLSENSGQSAAMYYGMQSVRGEVVALLDADLQNDPRDIETLLRLMDEQGLDIVTGVRTKRQDNWVRRVSSQWANAIRSRLLNDRTSDTGCTLKVLKTELAQRLPGWNGMHRFIPAHALAMGYASGETGVSHRARHAGVSKVSGGKRAWRVVGDLIGMLWFLSRQYQGRLKPEASTTDKPAS